MQTVNWEGGGEGAVARGVKSSLKKAHKPWIRGTKGAQTVNQGGAKPWSANRELGTFDLENSSVSVHSLHFMVCAPLNLLKMKYSYSHRNRRRLYWGTKKEHKPKLLSPDIFWVFHKKGWGPNISVCPSKPEKSNFLGCPGGARKVWEKKCVQFLAPIKGSAKRGRLRHRVAGDWGSGLPQA